MPDDAVQPRPERTGPVASVRPARPDAAARWDPGARYRPSTLAAVGGGRPTGAPALYGRLFRGPVRRTAVFDRELWRPRGGAPGPVTAAHRYRRGMLDTTGLLRAVGVAAVRVGR